MKHSAHSFTQKLISYAAGADIQSPTAKSSNKSSPPSSLKNYDLRTFVHEIVPSRVFLN